MIEVIDYTYLYLKNLYFKSLRWFVGGCTHLSVFNQDFHSKIFIFDKKLNLLEK
ncbi:orotate phosphoribosyltransferase [Helicobacter pylori]|uniref:orotate phosphoribosyltransferase n=1 Tax=Helicobacter pylori TaxID=210 RepID=UPI000BEC0A8D|nr:orotate phosphoribosyltransferase [Helicobacter pylori]